jgi:hypothetical protein
MLSQVVEPLFDAPLAGMRGDSAGAVVEKNFA